MARVIWLRAHARHVRLQEEIVLLLTEMEKTCATFHHSETKWKGREASSYPGWAARQAALWGDLRMHAATEFASVKLVYPPPDVTL